MDELINPKMVLTGLIAFLVPIACVFAMKWDEISAGFECDPQIGSMIHLYAPG